MAGEGRRRWGREYRAAWGEIFALAGEAVQFAWRPILLPALVILCLTGWIVGECIMLADGEYWQAAGVFVGALVAGLLLGGHVVACQIVRANREEQKGERHGG